MEKGESLDFLRQTAAIRAGEWMVRTLPQDLLDRRVEVIGQPDRKSTVDGLNSGARVYIADFEDALAPGWETLMEGQASLLERWTGKLAYADPASGKRHGLHRKVATLMVRPRGWIRLEERVRVDGMACSASLFDFGLTLFHNARAAVAQGSGPYFVLPKLESHGEARLWNQVFVHAQSLLGLPLGTVRATAMIETLPAAFEMDEIVYELRDHIAGLACDRRNYLASLIKTLGPQLKDVPDFNSRPDLRPAYLAAHAAELVRVCHRRGILAIGDVSTEIPGPPGRDARSRALERVKRDKEQEAITGFDGSRVAHCELVPVACKAFDDLMPTPNQLYLRRDGDSVERKALLDLPKAPPSAAEFGAAVKTGLQGLAAWLRGEATVVLGGVQITLADTDVARSLLWFWLKRGVNLDDGSKASRGVLDQFLADEMKELAHNLRAAAVKKGRYEDAQALLRTLVTASRPDLSLEAAARKRG
jgi:malate synthase